MLRILLCALCILIAISAVAFYFLSFYPYKDLQHQDPQYQGPLPQLSVMVHSSFASEFGPGPPLKKEFEKNCQCILRYKNAGDAGFIVKKLQWGFKADIVMGLDPFSIMQMGDSIGWKKTGITKTWNKHVKPIQNFLPYDWSPMTFIYRQGEVTPPSSWSQLLSQKEYKISLQDPRSSTPGLQFLWWLYHLGGYQPLSKTLSTVHPTNYRVSPSWSTAYGLFKAQKTHMAFSYLSSLLYHWNEEQDFRYQAVSLDSGHPLQVEYMGILASTSKEALAKKFIHWLLSPTGQSILVKYNFMFPSVKGAVKNLSSKPLPNLKILVHHDQSWQNFVAYLDEHLAAWKKH